MSSTRSLARLVAWSGLTAAGALHLIWASGSSWPAKNRKQLGEAVVGSAKAMPAALPTGIVGAAALAGGAIAAGALGEGARATGFRRLMGIGLIARAALGGEAALTALGLPPAGERFRELDSRYYRPLFGAIGAAVLIGARRVRTAREA